MNTLFGFALALALCVPCHGSRLGSRLKVHSSSRAGTTMRTALRSMVSEMYGKKSMQHIQRKMLGRMTLKDALPQLEGKLPQDVMAMLKLSEGSSKTKRAFSEASLEKARVYLNNMMYDGWLSLAQVETECLEYKDNNRMVFSQVVTDLEHLGSDLANAERMKVEAEGCIGDSDTRILDLEGILHRIKRNFQSIREKNAEELSMRQDDQDVFTAILQISKCPNESPDNTYSLAQYAHSKKAIQFCDTGNGTEVVVGDPNLAARIDKSPRVREVLQGLLRNGGAQEVSDDSNSDAAPPSFLQANQAPQAEDVQKSGGAWNKCVNGRVNCGYLHDLMALEWGKFKDLVDELTYVMQRNRDKYEGEKENMNEQIATLRSNKMRCQEMLGEATSAINTLTAAKSEKEEQHRDIEEAYRFKHSNCDGRVADILGNLCGTRIVRNNLMKYSTVSPTASITDCDFTDWSKGPCTVDGRGNSLPVDCDDSCPNDVGGVDVNTCGGVTHLTRQVITPPNEFGMACPPMFFESKNGTAGIKCNQVKCPIHCQMSMWTGWSACSKECGSGTQGKSRSILVKPKNGGTECDTTLEEQPCNTESCDRDCTLAPWTDWEPCSMACGGGMQKRVRKVDIPIRANGKCPNPEHGDRLQWQSCNTQECVGDEICIAKQDLVLAIDGSGSLKQEGFDAVKKFAINMTAKYQSAYYGVEDMRVGLVLFGNGEYHDDGTVTAALEVVSLTSDIESVSTAIEQLEWQRGFTNMMQAFSTAETMFAEGRKEAQSAILMISDGKYTNAYRTSMKAQEMKDAGVQIFMAPIAEHATPNLVNIKKWASSPWETNYERIPGLDNLANNEDKFAQKLLVKFCPRAFSPSLRKAEEEQAGFLKLHEQGYPSNSCGQWGYAGWYASIDACMQRVKELGKLAFSYEDGGWWRGTCYTEAVDVTQELWDDSLNDRVNITCPGGAWIFQWYASTYILNPNMFGSLFAEN